MSDSLGVLEFSDEIVLTDKIYFDFEREKSVTVQDVISHLQGLEKISKKIPMLLDKLVAETDIKTKNVVFRCTSVEVEKLATGSLINWIKLRLQMAVTGESDPEIKKAVMEDIKNMSATWTIGMLMGCLAIGAIVSKGCFSGTPEGFHGLQQSFAVNIGSTFNITPEKVLPLLRKTAESATVEDVKAGVDFIRPARRSGGEYSSFGERRKTGDSRIYN